MTLWDWLPKSGLACVVVSVIIPVNSVAGETDKNISLPEAIIYQRSEQNLRKEHGSLRERIEQNQELQNQEHKQWLENQREKWEQNRQEQREWQESQEQLREEAQEERQEELRDKLRRHREINPI
jgi:uncharacterized membrane protein YgaE (UPF0421/DUF939 family)